MIIQLTLVLYGDGATLCVSVFSFSWVWTILSITMSVCMCQRVVKSALCRTFLWKLAVGQVTHYGNDNINDDHRHTLIFQIGSFSRVVTLFFLYCSVCKIYIQNASLFVSATQTTAGKKNMHARAQPHTHTHTGHLYSCVSVQEHLSQQSGWGGDGLLSTIAESHSV